MHRFVQGQDRAQTSLLPASLKDYVDAVNPARIIEAFVEALDLGALGFAIVSLSPPGAVNSCLLDPHADLFTQPDRTLSVAHRVMA